MALPAFQLRIPETKHCHDNFHLIPQQLLCGWKHNAPAPFLLRLDAPDCGYQRSPVYNQNIKEWTKTIIHNVVVWNKLNLVIGVRKIQHWIALWRNVFSELLFVDMYWKHYNTKTILSLRNSQNPTKYKNWTRLSSMHCDISPFFYFPLILLSRAHTYKQKPLGV